MLNPSGLCKCGCGLPAPLAKANRERLGHVKGEPTLWRHGHNQRVQSTVWIFTGTRWYVCGRDGRRYLWYRIVARNTIGRPLEPDEVVHHINGDETDDRPENLAVLSRVEHYAIHRRQGDVYVLTAEDRRKAGDHHRNSLTKACEACGKSVTRPASRFKPRTFCSSACWYGRTAAREQMVSAQRLGEAA